MARSFSNAKVLSTLVADGFSNVLARRGYAAASQGVASGLAKGGSPVTARNSNLMKKSAEEMAGTTEKVSWVPDPVTGYYRPENRANEIDVAELRAIFLKNKN